MTEHSDSRTVNQKHPEWVKSDNHITLFSQHGGGNESIE
jgi:hypothetical protein